MARIARVLAVLNLSPKILTMIAQVRGIVASSTDNPDLPGPTPSLDQISAHVDDLEDKNLDAIVRRVGALEARSAARLLVIVDMHQFKAFVQAAADRDMARGAAIITGAGLGVLTKGRRQKQIAAALRGERYRGGVRHGALRRGPGDVFWQMSANRTDWLDLPPTMQANTSVSGLAPLMLHFFRYRVLTRKGLGDWRSP